MTDRIVLTTRQAVAYLAGEVDPDRRRSMSPAGLLALAKAGDVPVFAWHGNQPRFSRPQLDEWARTHEARPPKAGAA